MADNRKIIQILICPNNRTYQGALLGLGSDGNIYAAEPAGWRLYYPCTFEPARQGE
jgi:hypothetical protein